MPEFIKIVALTALLVFAQELLRRGGRWAWWIPFGLAPLALSPYWLTTNDFDWFQWVKIYTIFFCCCWGTALRFTRLGDRSWARVSIPRLLGVNILEAVTVDVLAGGVAHGLVAVAGLILVGTIPTGRRTVTIDAGRYRDLHLPLTRGWVIAYTAWNWAFVSLNYPAYAGHHTAVLLAALIVGLIDPRLWTQTRSSTLGLNLLTMATFNLEMVSWLDASHWLGETATYGVAVAALAVTVISLAGPWGLARLRPAPVREVAVTAA